MIERCVFACRAWAMSPALFQHTVHFVKMASQFFKDPCPKKLERPACNAARMTTI